jgi:hypothetical protein
MDCCVTMRNAVNLRGREDAPTGPEQSGRLLGFQEGQDWADHCIPTFRATPPGRERLVTRRRALYARAADLCLLLTLHGSSDVWSGGRPEPACHAQHSELHLWALVAGHCSTWQAARVEVTQQREADEPEGQPLEEKVVEAMVQHTDVQPVD